MPLAKCVNDRLLGMMLGERGQVPGDLARGIKVPSDEIGDHQSEFDTEPGGAFPELLAKRARPEICLLDFRVSNSFDGA